MQRQTTNRRERSQNPVGNRIDMRSQHSLKGLHKAGTRAATNYNKLANIIIRRGIVQSSASSFGNLLGLNICIKTLISRSGSTASLKSN
jgi:hypothetical protein